MWYCYLSLYMRTLTLNSLFCINRAFESADLAQEFFVLVATQQQFFLVLVTGAGGDLQLVLQLVDDLQRVGQLQVGLVGRDLLRFYLLELGAQSRQGLDEVSPCGQFGLQFPAECDSGDALLFVVVGFAQVLDHGLAIINCLAHIARLLQASVY